MCGVGGVGQNRRVLLSEVVATSAAVAGSSGRRDKIDKIAGLLARVPADEVPIAVAFLSGELMQRQIGVGYAALIGLPDQGTAGGTAVDSESAEPLADGPAAADEAAQEAAEQAAVAADIAVAAGVAEAGGAAERASLTLAQTDAAFESIGAQTGPGSTAARRVRLAELIGRAGESERQFLFRLLAGDLRQGALEGVMAEAVARAAGVPVADVRRAHQLRGSLPDVASTALAAARGEGSQEDVIRALRAFTLRVGQPVRPMLAASAPSISAALERICPAALEWKIDGIRVQLHRSGQRVRVFTRTLDDITDRVPELVEMTLATQADSAVIDGEAVALQPDGRPHPFQVTSARVASHSSNSVPLTAFMFDLLHVDGEDLIDRPGEERFERLASIAPAEALIPRTVTSDPAQGADFFAAAIAGGHEGVVAKSPQAPYRAGRRGSDWIKVKPRTTLDLVILAAEWGHGRRSGWLSNLHLGARDPQTGGFVMLGKTFKGLTDAMLAWQTEQLLALAISPADLADGAGRRPFGVVRVRPELVAEIAFDGVQASSRYPGGVTLRFARVLRYRDDKRADEADTIDSVRALWPHGQAG